MNYRVSLSFDSLNNLDVILSIGQDGNDVYFTFSDNDIVNINDCITSFSKIFYNAKDPLILKYFGPWKRCIRFSNKEEASNVWMFLQRFYDFPGIGENYVYDIVIKKENEEPRKKSVMNSSKIIKVTKALEDKFNIKGNIEFEEISQLYLNKRTFEISDTNLFDYIHKEETHKLKDEYNLSELKFNKKGIFKLFDLFFLNDFGNKMEDYIQLKKQWETITIEQWENDKLLQSFVCELENNIEKTGFSESFRKLIFDIIISYYFHNFCENFESYIFEFAIMFIKSYFVCAINSNCFVDINRKERTLDEAAAMVFWSLQKLNNHFIDYNSKEFELIPHQAVYDFITKKLNDTFPQIKKFIDEKQLKDFSFLNMSLKELFVSKRYLEETQMMICFLLISKDPLLFFFSFICSIFIELDKTTYKLTPELINSIGFINDKINTLNFMLLLVNTDEILKHL